MGPKEKSAMSEQAIEERRGWASDIVWVMVYSMLVLLVMLLWVYVRRKRHGGSRLVAAG